MRVNGAGRTDAGVHALGQVAHIDLAKDYKADRVRDALKRTPAGRIRSACCSAEIVPETFDARFSATKRHYIYRIA